MLKAMDALYYWFLDMGLDNDTSAIFSFTLYLMFFMFIINFIKLIFHIIAEWIFFNKCGEKGWKALIPIYNEITLVKISGLSWWWIFLIYATSIYSIILFPIEIIAIFYESVTMFILTIILSSISFLISATTVISKINVCNNLSKKFNKGAGHTALLFFFESIMFLIMGLSADYKYDNDLTVPLNGFFGSKK